MDRIFETATQFINIYQSRKPFELLDAIGAITRISHNFSPDGLKGFACIQNGSMYAVINGHLDEHEQNIVAGHEAAHLILHKEEMLYAPGNFIEEGNLFANTGRLEHQANQFLADFLLDDKDTLDLISQMEGDYFQTACALCVPPALFTFKLHSMINRGFPLCKPTNLESGFLGTP